MVKDTRDMLCITSLVELEVRNRLRTLSLSARLAESAFREAQYLFSALITRGAVRRFHMRDTKPLVAESLRLIDHFSSGVPHGAMDVLHIACARMLKSTTFLTFDANQKSLALASGMNVEQ
jgi:hypothetical protein